ncbi:MAG: hypothetical protein HHJ09_05585 [Glaciimonas sp.]|nr:hypothetical protein [Glaciimonas sp.]
MRHLNLLLPLSVALAACATSGLGDDAILIETSAQGRLLTGVACTVANNAGNWKIITPAKVNPGRANGDLHVLCSQSGYRTAEVVYQAAGVGTSGSSVGIGLGSGGGNVGFGVGLNFPVHSGGGAAYPARITVEMNPL